MSPVTHFEISWIIAHIPKRLGRTERGLLLLTGTIPDLDGIGILFHGDLYVEYHHLLLHNLLFGIIISFLFSLLKAKNKVLVGTLCLIVFHVHMVCDLLGSGPGWPIAYLWPLSSHLYYFEYQWNLASWQNFAITVTSTFLLFYVAVKFGRTPIEFVSKRIDEKVVSAVRYRWDKCATQLRSFMKSSDDAQ
jgi:inner membrane protein